MSLDFTFFVNSILLGVGLAMDAFSVSLADGLSDHGMRIRKMLGIASMFSLFQALMPFIGWVLVHNLASYLPVFNMCIPWIALALLGFIGGKMIYESVAHSEEEEKSIGELTFATLLVQSVATSIDALSVGFTIPEYNLWKALTSVGIIALVTFPICTAGLFIGKRAGTRLSAKAGILGGVILILIGIEIFLTGIL